MFKTLIRSAIVASLLAITALLGGLLSGPSTEAQGLDPESVVTAFAEALNAGQGEAAISLFAEDAIFTDIDGGSFAAVDHPAISFILGDASSDPDFHVEIIEISAAGATVTGVAEVTDVGAVAAGVDRYIQPFTFVVVDGKIAESHFTYDESDAQTQTYLDYTAEGGEEEAPARFTQLELSGTQAGTAFVADAAEFGAPDLSAVGVELAATGSQPANVYEGTCATLGAVASRLAVVMGEGSFSFISADYDTLTSEPHAIAVSASETDSTVVACGNIGAASTTPTLPKTGMSDSSTDGTPFAPLAIALAVLGAVAVVSTGAARVARRS
ncbi:MAG: nuclear transport factor 2 family protein [Dehalococcoidia bacterium]